MSNLISVEEPGREVEDDRLPRDVHRDHERPGEGNLALAAGRLEDEDRAARHLDEVARGPEPAPGPVDGEAAVDLVMEDESLGSCRDVAGEGTDVEVAKRLGLTRVVVFDYSEKVSFDVSRSELKPEGLPILDRQAEILARYFPNVDVYVCGHTDATGGEDFNLQLSIDRARVVADRLSGRGVPHERLKVQGFGKEFPNDTNETPAGRANNRRTELVLPQ